ncbi:hypothetical protein BD413DRAFT_521125 [Trametes elegans]|nr:hypothetical protein BD413DRAFT_521125 [Trametes elegans]
MRQTTTHLGNAGPEGERNRRVSPPPHVYRPIVRIWADQEAVGPTYVPPRAAPDTQDIPRTGSKTHLGSTRIGRGVQPWAPTGQSGSHAPGPLARRRRFAPHDACDGAHFLRRRGRRVGGPLVVEGRRPDGAGGRTPARRCAAWGNREMNTLSSDQRRWLGRKDGRSRSASERSCVGSLRTSRVERPEAGSRRTDRKVRGRPAA